MENLVRVCGNLINLEHLFSISDIQVKSNHNLKIFSFNIRCVDKQVIIISLGTLDFLPKCKSYYTKSTLSLNARELVYNVTLEVEKGTLLFNTDDLLKLTNKAKEQIESVHNEVCKLWKQYNKVSLVPIIDFNYPINENLNEIIDTDYDDES